jgi:hypothetical protein
MGEIMTEAENLPALKGESSVDERMVDEAKNKIKSILTEHFGAAAYEVVDYLVKHFFKVKKENLKKIRLDSHQSFQKLLEMIQGETGKSKSWVYESIKLWQDREFLSDFEPYMQLSISHRALLIKVSDLEKKKGYAQEFYTKQLPYKEARDMLRSESPNTTYSILSRLINHPTDFEEEEFKEKIAKVELIKTFNSLKNYQRSEIVNKVKQRVDTLEKEIIKQNELLEKAKLVQSKLVDISAAESSDDAK